MGSGTTGVAAVLEGRRFTGFEKSVEMAALARDRIIAAGTACGAASPAVTARAASSLITAPR